MMNNLSESVKELLNTADSKDMYFLGRRPSIKQIYNELTNFENFDKNNISNKSRTNMGTTCSLDDRVVGYNSFTIMQNASPTPYEKKALDMGSNLNYFYLRKLFVHPDFRSQGIGTKFIKQNMKLAKGIDKHCIADIEKNNYNMINILIAQGFNEDYNWESWNGKNMVRFFHD